PLRTGIGASHFRGRLRMLQAQGTPHPTASRPPSPSRGEGECAAMAWNSVGAAGYWIPDQVRDYRGMFWQERHGWPNEPSSPLEGAALGVRGASLSSSRALVSVAGSGHPSSDRF